MMVSNISVAFVAILAAAIVIPAAKKKYWGKHREKSKRFHNMDVKNIKNMKKI